MAEISAKIVNREENGNFEVEVGIADVSIANFVIMVASIVEEASTGMGVSNDFLMKGIEHALIVHAEKEEI